MSPDPKDMDIQTFDGAVRQGLSQGSRASNSIAGMLLGPAVEELTSADRVVIYGDDIAIAAADEVEAEALKHALSARLASHPAGPFQLKSCFVGSATDGFNFLKYKHTMNQYTGEVRLRPSWQSYQRYHERVVALTIQSPPKLLARQLASYRLDWMRSFLKWKWNQVSKNYLYDSTMEAVGIGMHKKKKKAKFVEAKKLS